MLGRISFVALLASAAVAMAQTRPASPQTRPATPDTPAAAAVRQVLVQIVTAVSSGEVDKAKALTDKSNADLGKILDSMAAESASWKKLTAAAEAKFGANAPGNLHGGDFSTEAMTNRIYTRPIEVQANQAVLRGDEMTLQRRDGKWVLTAFSNDPRIGQMFLAILPKVAKLNEEVAADIQAGKYASLPEAQGALQEKGQAIAREAMRIMMSPAGPSGNPGQ